MLRITARANISALVLAVGTRNAWRLAGVAIQLPRNGLERESPTELHVRGLQDPCRRQASLATEYVVV